MLARGGIFEIGYRIYHIQGHITDSLGVIGILIWGPRHHHVSVSNGFHLGHSNYKYRIYRNLQGYVI